MWVYIVIGVIVVGVLVYAFAAYNSFVKLDNRVKEAFSTMDIYLKKRWDLIPNLVEVVKGYAKHEKDTLKEVVEIRKDAYDSLSDAEKLRTNTKLNLDISKLMAIAEAYPNLKADKNFKDLSHQLTRVEDEIANSRKYYNATVRMFNNKIQTFPSSILAKIFGYKPGTMFEAAPSDRENVKIKL